MSPARMLALLLAMAATAAADASAAVAPGGLHGVVMRGPISPVCRDNVPCDAPAPGVSLTFVRAGVSSTTRSDAKGRYRIVLPAGIYALRPAASANTVTRQLGKMTPDNVRVRVGHSDRIDFMIDTGIR